MKLVNIDYLPGEEITEVLGLVKGTIVQSKNIGRDFMAADAIINIRYGSSSVMNGAAEVIAYGTAVKTKKC